MNKCAVQTALAAGVLLLASLGCERDKQQVAVVHPEPTALHSNTVLRCHWMGKNALGVAANAYSFMQMWELPESKQLEVQFLSRLAMSIGGPADNGNVPLASSTLAALMDDVLKRESFLEIRLSTNKTIQFVLAIRMDYARADVWYGSLASVISSTRGVFPANKSNGWVALDPKTQSTIEFTSVGDWALIGVASGSNPLLEETKQRIYQVGTPAVFKANKAWLEIDAESGWLARQLGLNLEAKPEMPRVSLSVSGNGAQVITSGELFFEKPLNLPLEPWTFPRDMVQGEVVGFGAARGFGSFLQGTRVWKELEVRTAPNQLFTWTETADPLLRQKIAVPLDHATQLTDTLGKKFAPRATAWLTSHATGRVETWSDAPGIIWTYLPVISPYLLATNDSLIIGGMLPNPPPSTNTLIGIYPRPSLDELLATLNRQTNLVAFEWETTGERAESIHVLGQVLRVIMRHPQMPPDTASSQWLQSIRLRLGNTTTLVTLVAPNRLAYERKSTVGFNALELHALADWMESPTFPHGFYITRSHPVTLEPDSTPQP